MLNLRPFQRRFIRAAFDPATDTAVLSLPRGNGKSTLAGHILAQALTPGHEWNQPGSEYLLGAASIEQARHVFRAIRTELEPTGAYRFIDSVQRLGAVHKDSNTRLRVISSSGKRAMGVVGVPLWVLDEPGSFETVGGELLWDAAQTALGKPGSPLRVIAIGTIAPSRGGWWQRLVERGTHGSTHVTALQGDLGSWDAWPTIRKCNPLAAIDAKFRRTLLAERDEARADSRLKARFLSYRLNIPSADESEVLLTVPDWERVLARPVPEPAGRPVVGIDLGAGRAWSAAVAGWPNGRVEALAVAPGIPAIAEQERRDRVPRGTYAKLIESGALRVAQGLRVQPASELWDAVTARWGTPRAAYCDRFRLAELRDAARGFPHLVPRVGRWSESSADIRALRKAALDGGLAVESSSRGLLTASMAAAMVQNDDGGNVRMIKRGTNNEGRDDVAAALVLVAGALERLPPERTEPLRLLIAR